jgi:hypothetical protein
MDSRLSLSSFLPLWRQRKQTSSRLYTPAPMWPRYGLAKLKRPLPNSTMTPYFDETSPLLRLFFYCEDVETSAVKLSTVCTARTSVMLQMQAFMSARLCNVILRNVANADRTENSKDVIFTAHCRHGCQSVVYERGAVCRRDSNRCFKSVFNYIS